ncbi:MAG: serine/threonine-protein phosphatase, partial [Desulfobulbaceae bacterium]|nr:serine/threonine-protein phosphatase [Desulfobulbaceae bacterium]
DIYLICSDGLTTMLETKEISRIFDEHADLKDLAQALTAEANEAGGRDNITVLLISAQQNT